VRHHHRVVQIDLTALPDDPNILQQMLREAVPELQAENEKLWQLIQRLLRHRYGPRSERLDLEQLQLVLEDAEQSAAEDDAAKGAAEPAERRRRIEVAHRNRGALPAHLPRYEVVIDIESKECPCCGGALHLIGDDRTEMLDLVPAQLRVKVVCRPRYGCRSCEGAVVQAPAPERPIDGGMATEALVAHIVVSKFCDALPLHRQAQMLKRQGITLDRSTLSAWVGRACWWLTPLYELVLGTVLSSNKLFADETTLPVLDPGRGKTKTGRLWCYAVDNRPWTGSTHPAAAYVFSEDRRGEHPTEHLAAFRGTLQVDGYAGFGKLVEARSDASIKLAFCWAHARRPFYEFYTSTQSPLAAEVLARIAKLYAIEADIRGQPPDVRQSVRQMRSRPLVEALQLWLQDRLPRVPGWSDLAKAMRYILRHWDGLILYLDDGRLEMGRVEVWRGCCRLDISVSAPFVWRCLTSSTLAPSPHPARQTGRADFPHPAFSRPIRPSLSAGRRDAAERYRGRVSRRDTRLGPGGTQRLVAQHGASTSGGSFAQCRSGRAHRFP
jgi:transposase